MGEEAKTENVKVYVRVRPLNRKEVEEDQICVAGVGGDNSVCMVKSEKERRMFVFNKVFGPSSSQKEVYEDVAVPIVEKVLDGYNGTIFAYGQSGSGKTYTMIGDVFEDSGMGMVPNIFYKILNKISFGESQVSYVVNVAFMEIYNEEVRDLLSGCPTKKLFVRESTDSGVYVKDLCEFPVDSIKTVHELLKIGSKNRATASTKLNDSSSRSHAILTISVESKDSSQNRTCVGKLNLVDLAGSERVIKTAATGDRLREAGKINLSLSVLGNVISALIDPKVGHIPYRNSKLTRILQDSLGGNSLTSMVAMISPSEADYSESICTLMYAERVKKIKNYPCINLEKNGLIEQFHQEIQKLQEQLSLLNVPEVKLRRPSTTTIRNKSKRDEELLEVQTKKLDLTKQINDIQKRILIGGENLFEKRQEQEDLLRSSDLQIRQLDDSHKEMTKQLLQTEAEKTNFELSKLDLQQENELLDKAIETVERAIGEIEKLKQDNEKKYKRELGRLLDESRALKKETSLVTLLIQSAIPREDLIKITSNLSWSKEVRSWKLNGVAYTGNNLNRKDDKNLHEFSPRMNNYFSYT